jgi:hypothetical protein
MNASIAEYSGELQRNLEIKLIHELCNNPQLIVIFHH